MQSEPEPTDEILAQRARGGDEEAFRTLFERHASALRRRVRRRLPALLRRKIAESDVLQMAYLGVHQNLDGFEARGAGSFEAWLRTIVDRRVTDAVRRYVQTGRRELWREVSGPEALSGSHLLGRDPTPSIFAMESELHEAVRAAVARLPEAYRQVLHLVQREGLTLEEAGRRMDRSAGAAKQLYGRALGRLRRLVRQREGRDHG